MASMTESRTSGDLRKRNTVAATAKNAADMTTRMICGGLSGMIAKTATNPLERIKMLSQTGEHGVKDRVGVIGLYRSILRNEGVLGLWAGNGANLLRVFPAKAVVFSCNDKYRDLLYRVSGTPRDQPLAASLSFLAGGMAGMTATAATYPLDFARGRISGKIATAGHTKHYKGIIRTVILSAKEEGFFALYKGVTPTILGAMPYEGIKFGTVGILEKYFPKEHSSEHAQSSTVIRKVCFGGLGGVMAGLITYPNDTVRRMLQLQGSRGTTTVYTGYWDCVRKVIQQHGVTRLYHGCFINIVRMAPNTAVQFGSYELLKQTAANWLHILQ